MDTATSSVAPREQGTFVEQADYEKGFAAYYDREVKPMLATMEAQRLLILKETLRRKRALPHLFGIVVLVTVCFAAIAMQFGAESFNAVMFPGSFAVIVCFILGQWMLLPARNFAVDRESLLLTKVSAFFGLAFREVGKVTRDELNTSLIVDPGSPGHLTSSEEVYGTYHDTELHFANVIAAVPGKDAPHVTFSGLFLAAKMAKTFTGKTLVLGKYDVSDQKRIAFGGFKVVNLEADEFHRVFDVFGTDQMEARYVLTPDIMERLLKLPTLFHGSTVSISFCDHHLFIASHTSQQFFPSTGIEISLYNTDDIHAYLQHMQLIFEIIDLLRVDKV